VTEPIHTARHHERRRQPYSWVVRHATASALDELEPFLERLRALPSLVERNRGTFYRRGAAFLHFHEDATGMYADIRLHDAFERFRIQTVAEQDTLLALIVPLL